jgi:ERCC4-related helicase
MERVDGGTRLAAHLLIHSLTHSTVSVLRAFPSHSASGFSAKLNNIKEKAKHISVVRENNEMIRSRNKVKTLSELLSSLDSNKTHRHPKFEGY